MHPVVRLTTLLVTTVLAVSTAACGGGSSDDSTGDRVATEDRSSEGSAAPSTGPASEPTETAPTDLAGRTLVVTDITVAGKPRPVADGTQIRFRFTETEVHIDSGCNGLGGTWTLVGDTLELGPLMGTMMACEPPRTKQEQWLRTTLEAPLTVGDGSLSVGDVVFTVADREQVSPDLELAGHRWVLDSLISEQAVSSVPGGVRAWLEYDGTRLTLDAGCNRGSGKAKLRGDMLTVSGIATTKMACGPEQSEVERAVLGVLDGEVTVEIEERRLTLTAADGSGLGFTAAD